ncbi:MAG: DEAD/DEAH box helicase [Deltaproteobacteria bacterium]|nr:DEAD/DEAH box helicase [Deltaproteobacteria bacterium]
MKLFELGRYNIPEKIIDSWIDQIGEDLLPVQERAIKRYRVLDGNSVIISSPTTSGKTFVGEIAAVKGVMEKKKVIYLVPLKSLADEKYLDFKRKYEQFGIKTVVSSSDHREYDRVIEEGEFGIAIIVYEKMSQLLVKNPFLLKNIALVIIDELQEIGDPSRGPGLEITMTKISTSQFRPQILGLSAVLGNTETLARWLKTDFLFHDKRPVELYEGVLYKGIFHYKTYNTYEKREEPLVSIDSEELSRILMANVVHLANQGDQILVFLPSKRETMILARQLAEAVNLPEAEGAIGELAILEDTSLKKGLIHCLKSSIAFHHADLSSEERNVIETYTRSGEIRVVCCTTTLALGVNLPATTVFLDARKWEYDERTDSLILSPMSWAEYENISGRAGRLGYEMDFGRSITIATSDYEYQMIWQNYIEGEEEILTSQLNKQDLDDHIINIMASDRPKTRQKLEDFLLKTYMGVSEGREAIRKNLEESLGFLTKYQLVRQLGDEKLKVSPLGNVVAVKGISSLTAVQLARFLKEIRDREASDLEIIHAAASTEEGQRIYIQMTRNERISAKYENIVREMFKGQEDYIGKLLTDVINSPFLLDKPEAKNLKLALLMERWIQGKDTPAIERDFESYYGTIATAAAAMSWIVDAAQLVAWVMRLPKPLQKRLAILSDRLLFGVEEKGLELARLKVRGLGRAGIKRLIFEGYDSKKAVQEASLPLLAKVIPEKIAINLKQAVEPKKKRREKETSEEAKIPEARFACKDHIEITGRPLKKRNKVFINGYAIGLTNRSLEVLLQLAVTLKRDGQGWVHKEDIASNLGAPQLVSRLRNEIRNHTLNKDGKIIESNGSGSYRLSIPPNNVTIDKQSLSKHWNAVVRKLAQKV